MAEVALFSTDALPGKRKLNGEVLDELERSESMVRFATGGDGVVTASARAINDGKMVSDDTANALMLRELSEPSAASGFVLDGYPRTVGQARTLDEFLAGRGERLGAVVALVIGEAEIIERLGNRITCPRCGETYNAKLSPPKAAGVCDVCGLHGLSVREDDLPEHIMVRLGLYKERTKPLLGYYEAGAMLLPVDAEGTEEEVFARVLAALGGRR